MVGPLNLVSPEKIVSVKLKLIEFGYVRSILVS